jgi:hypothetical protein
MAATPVIFLSSTCSGESVVQQQYYYHNYNNHYMEMGNFYNCLNRGMYKLRQGNGLFSYFYVYLFHNPFSSPELHFEDLRLASPISE